MSSPTVKALSVFCVACGASSGAPCVSARGLKRPPHAARVGVAADPGYWRQLARRKRLAALASRPEVVAFLVSCALGAAIALSGCGQVDAAAAAGDGAAGSTIDAGPNSSTGGAAGAQLDGAAGAGATGGAAAAGHGGAGEASHGGNGGAAGSQTGGAGGTAGAVLPTCPKVGGLLFEVNAHCFECSGQTDAGTVTGSIAGPCQISAADVGRFQAAAAPAYCVSRSGGSYPALCY